MILRIDEFQHQMVNSKIEISDFIYRFRISYTRGWTFLQAELSDPEVVCAGYVNQEITHASGTECRMSEYQMLLRYGIAILEQYISGRLYQGILFADHLRTNVSTLPASTTATAAKAASSTRESASGKSTATTQSTTSRHASQVPSGPG